MVTYRTGSGLNEIDDLDAKVKVTVIWTNYDENINNKLQAIHLMLAYC